MTISHSLHDAFHSLLPLSRPLLEKTTSHHASYARDTVHGFTRHDCDMRLGDKENSDFPTRADSFAQMSDVAMTEGDDDEEDDAIIKCICDYGKGIDDDNAICCDQCGTWQHTLCLFYQTPLPRDDEQYLCTSCRPRQDVDARAARDRMRGKLEKLERLSDQILELECEGQQRSAEVFILSSQKAQLEHEISTNGPGLEECGTYAAYAMLDDWARGVEHLQAEMGKTEREREAILRRIAEVEDDLNRIRRNERTREEEIMEKWRRAGEGPKLFTTACALGRRAAVPHTLPPILMVALGPKVKVKKGV